MSHNSTMVRFKPEKLHGKHKGDCRHNSTMVRFKLVDSQLNLYSTPRHNSTMVRFKLIKPNQKGQKGRKSQFHYGSIQTSIKIDAVDKAKKCHNSTMVRFKHIAIFEGNISS